MNDLFQSLKKSNIFFIFGMFVILYNPPLFPINGMHIVGALSILYLILHYNTAIKALNNLYNLRIICSFLFVLGYLFVTVKLINNEDSVYVLMPIYYLLDTIPFGLSLKCHGDKNGFELDDYINICIFAGVVQSLIAILCVISPGVHDFCFQLFKNYGYSESIYYLFKYRMFGLASGLTFAMPVLHAFLTVIVLSPRKGIKAYNVIVAALLLVSAVINARISMFVILIGFGVLILLSDFSTKRKVTILCSTTIGVVLFLSIGLLLIREFSEVTYDWVVSGMGEVSQFVHGNTNTIYFSYITNSQQYRLPQDFLHLCFGKGHTVMGKLDQYGYASDVGFINDIWLGGCVYCFLIYRLFFKIFNKLRKNDNKTIALIGIMSMVLYPILNFKGAVCDSNSFSIFIFLLFFAAFPSKNNEILNDERMNNA